MPFGNETLSETEYMFLPLPLSVGQWLLIESGIFEAAAGPVKNCNFHFPAIDLLWPFFSIPSGFKIAAGAKASSSGRSLCCCCGCCCSQIKLALN